MDFLFHNIILIAIAAVTLLVVDSFTLRLFATNKTKTTVKVVPAAATETKNITESVVEEVTIPEELTTEVKDNLVIEVDFWAENLTIDTEMDTKLEGFIEPEDFMGVPVEVEIPTIEYQKMNIRDLRDWIYAQELQDSVRLISGKSLGKLKKAEMIEALDTHFGLISIESAGLVLI